MLEEAFADNITTVDDLIKSLKTACQGDDELLVRVNKKEAFIFDIYSKAGRAVIDLYPGNPNKTISEDDTCPECGNDPCTCEGETEKCVICGKDIDGYGNNAAPVKDEGSCCDKCNQDVVIPARMKALNEQYYGSYKGGFGGSGKSYRRLSHDERSSLRGADIGWYAVADMDPYNRGRIESAWRCGPSNFREIDFLYPERKYVKGAMLMKNKHAKIGSTTAPVSIYFPSYFDAINNNDQEAMHKLLALGIPLDLKLGMIPNDDYTSQYTV